MTISTEELLEALRRENRLRQQAEARRRESDLMITGMQTILRQPVVISCISIPLHYSPA